MSKINKSPSLYKVNKIIRTTLDTKWTAEYTSTNTDDPVSATPHSNSQLIQHV